MITELSVHAGNDTATGAIPFLSHGSGERVLLGNIQRNGRMSGARWTGAWLPGYLSGGPFHGTDTPLHDYCLAEGAAGRVFIPAPADTPSEPANARGGGRHETRGHEIHGHGENTTRIFHVADFGFAGPGSGVGDDMGGEIEIGDIWGEHTGSLSLLTGSLFTDSPMTLRSGDFVSARAIGAGEFIFTPMAGASGSFGFSFHVWENGGPGVGVYRKTPAPKTLTIRVEAAHGGNVAQNAAQSAAPPAFAPRAVDASFWLSVEDGAGILAWPTAFPDFHAPGRLPLGQPSPGHGPIEPVAEAGGASGAGTDVSTAHGSILRGPADAGIVDIPAETVHIAVSVDGSTYADSWAIVDTSSMDAANGRILPVNGAPASGAGAGASAGAHAIHWTENHPGAIGNGLVLIDPDAAGDTHGLLSIPAGGRELAQEAQENRTLSAPVDFLDWPASSKADPAGRGKLFHGGNGVGEGPDLALRMAGEIAEAAVRALEAEFVSVVIEDATRADALPVSLPQVRETPGFPSQGEAVAARAVSAPDPDPHAVRLAFAGHSSATANRPEQTAPGEVVVIFTGMPGA